MTGTLVGIGVGPGSPDLLTLRALHELRRADLVIAPSSDEGRGRAETVVAELLPELKIDRLILDMSAPQASRTAAYEAIAVQLVPHLSQDRRVACITLGDPNVYSTFSSIAAAVVKMLPDLTTITVPGIMAVQEMAARTGTVLTDGTESLHLLTDLGSDDEGERLESALNEQNSTIALYKSGRNFAAVRTALEKAGRIDEALVGELLGFQEEQLAPVREVESDHVAYLGTVLVPAVRR